MIRLASNIKQQKRHAMNVARFWKIRLCDWESLRDLGWPCVLLSASLSMVMHVRWAGSSYSLCMISFVLCMRNRSYNTSKGNNVWLFSNNSSPLPLRLDSCCFLSFSFRYTTSLYRQSSSSTASVFSFIISRDSFGLHIKVQIWGEVIPQPAWPLIISIAR